MNFLSRYVAAILAAGLMTVTVTAAGRLISDFRVEAVAAKGTAAARLGSTDAYVREVSVFAQTYDATPLPLGTARFFSPLQGLTKAKCIAFEDLEKTLDRSVQTATTQHNLGWTSIRCRSGDELRHFEEAVRLEPREPIFRASLGLLEEQTGRKNDALKEFAWMLALNPRTARSAFFADLTDRDSTSASTALQIALTLLRREPSNVVTESKISSLEDESGNPASCDGAAGVLRRRRDLVGPYIVLGSCAGDYANAKQAYATASRLDPVDVGLVLRSRLSSSIGTEALLPSDKHLLIVMAERVPQVSYQVADANVGDLHGVLFANDILPQRLVPYVTQMALEEPRCRQVANSREQFSSEDWRRVSYLLASLCAERWLRKPLSEVVADHPPRHVNVVHMPHRQLKLLRNLLCSP